MECSRSVVELCDKSFLLGAGLLNSKTHNAAPAEYVGPSRWLRTEALKFSQLQISEQMARQGSFTNVKSGHPGGLFHRSAIVPDIHGLVSRRELLQRL